MLPPVSLSSSPTISRISLTAKFQSGATSQVFSSSEKASDYLIANKQEIEKVTKLYILHCWGEIQGSEKPISSWTNQRQGLGEHEWKQYSSDRLQEEFYYVNGDDVLPNSGSKMLSPLLAVALIKESEISSTKEIFDRAVKRKDSRCVIS